MTIQYDNLNNQVSVVSSTSNASLNLVPKGTGSVNVVAGSSGVNLSNGGTVTAITLISGGSNYTSFPSVAISAPTTAGGVQATASVARIFAIGPTVANGGTGYTLNDVVTLVGGTPVGAASTYTVSAVSGGVVTALTPINYAVYTAIPSNPSSTTGGTGTGLTINALWSVQTFTITNAGSGYVEQPTVTISGGGGSLATAYATVGSGTTIKSLGSTISFVTPNNQTAFQVVDYGGSATSGYWASVGGNAQPQLWATGTNSAIIATTSAVPLIFGTGGGGNAQFRLSHTAAAVNYLQATGATTTNGPVISSQGSDTNIGINLTTKGTGSHVFNTGSGKQLQIADSAISGGQYTLISRDNTNNVQLIGTAGNAANLGLYAYAGGSVRIYTNPGLIDQQLVIAPTASAVNYVQVTGAATGGAAPIISTQGSDSNITLGLQSKGNASVALLANTRVQFDVFGGASSVNYIRAAGANTGVAPSLTCLGSDTNIPLVLQPKGTGALQAQQTDSTATGGNARGANAVDWQTTRDAASRVANGQAAVLSGGYANTSSALYSVVSGGGANTASGTVSTVSGGFVNTASAYGAVVSGGQNNTASNTWASIVGGKLNSALGFFNFIGAGYTNSGTANGAVTTQSGTMNATTAVTLSGSNANIKVGQFITGTSIGDDTYVAAISGTSLTLSKVASGSSTSTLSFYTPHGVVVGGGNNQATGSYSFIGGGGDAGTAGNRNVASGIWSTIGGGIKNTASQDATFVGGGYGNTASGLASAVVGGGLYGNIQQGQIAPNTSSGQATFIGAGFNNIASGYAAAVVGGNGNLASSNYSIASGASATTRGIVNSFAYGSITISGTLGVSQSALVVLGVETTNATATVLRSDASAAGTTNQVILPNNSAYYVKGSVIANVTGGGNTKSWDFVATIKRGANAASAAIVGATTINVQAADAGASAWTIAITADTTNGGLAVTVTGQASTTIRWVAKLETTEVTY